MVRVSTARQRRPVLLLTRDAVIDQGARRRCDQGFPNRERHGVHRHGGSLWRPPELNLGERRLDLHVPGGDNVRCRFGGDGPCQ